MGPWERPWRGASGKAAWEGGPEWVETLDWMLQKRVVGVQQRWLLSGVLVRKQEALAKPDVRAAVVEYIAQGRCGSELMHVDEGGRLFLLNDRDLRGALAAGLAAAEDGFGDFVGQQLHEASTRQVLLGSAEVLPPLMQVRWS